MIRRIALTAWIVALALVVYPTKAQSIEEFEKNLTIETLDNGLTLILYERKTAPVVSFFTYVDVGSAHEVPGITGLAHMFEHMAFKGTSKIGTKNRKAEIKAMADVDRAYAAYATARDRRDIDEAELVRLETQLKAAQDRAGELVAKNEFAEIIDRNGGVGLNAGTSADYTVYSYSLPANKLELFAYLESERFLDPVLREFYRERDVVQEERRMSAESRAFGRLFEQFVTVAYSAHPYGMPNVGYMSDLQRFTREDAKAFYAKYYVPSNMTVVVVGDVDTKKALPLLRKYFGRLPAGKKPAPPRTIEPPQFVEKTIVMPDESQPLYAEAYHRPAAIHPDDAVYNAISDILSGGRTSRLYRGLVRDKKIAAFASAFNGFPGDKYPTLMLFYAVPTPDSSNEQVQVAIREEIERLKTEPVSEDELEMVKTQAKAGLIRSLQSNGGIASQLATAHVQFGDWREIFNQVAKIEAVTAEDVRRVAQETFVSTNRTVGMIVNEDEN
ncbi:MAG: insulinase family protein [Acidobacteria bacterium]|nr:insulinase family protein [Acidobacteriota bacterium]NIM60217.1 insulinase family protein [Acidobacteriota bacterium]NIO60255.1 insulinase family protein [Acidobacteriota bacterium]NIQ31310.1 insulinase family protein [Acidobacteriota bacterium]NIQ86533.1 insulinase family protein [Acidobacteriota bacterium]